MNKFFDLDIKLATESGFLAIASTPRIDRDGEILDPFCFAPLPDRTPMLLHHDRTKVCGSGVPFYEGDLLKIKGVFSNTPYGLEAKDLTVNKHIRTVSVGYANSQYEVDRRDGLRHLRKAELCEVSFVAVPSNVDAQVLVARSHNARPMSHAMAMAKARTQIALVNAYLALHPKEELGDHRQYIERHGARAYVDAIKRGAR